MNKRILIIALFLFFFSNGQDMIPMYQYYLNNNSLSRVNRVFRGDLPIRKIEWYSPKNNNLILIRSEEYDRISGLVIKRRVFKDENLIELSKFRGKRYNAYPYEVIKLIDGYEQKTCFDSRTGKNINCK